MLAASTSIAAVAVPTSARAAGACAFAVYRAAKQSAANAAEKVDKRVRIGASLRASCADDVLTTMAAISPTKFLYIAPSQSKWVNVAPLAKKCPVPGTL